MKYFNSFKINFSGYVDANMIMSYIDSGYRKKYAKRGTQAFNDAIKRCDEFLADPIVYFMNL